MCFYLHLSEVQALEVRMFLSVVLPFVMTQPQIEHKLVRHMGAGSGG